MAATTEPPPALSDAPPPPQSTRESSEPEKVSEGAAERPHGPVEADGVPRVDDGVAGAPAPSRFRAPHLSLKGKVAVPKVAVPRAAARLPARATAIARELRHRAGHFHPLKAASGGSRGRGRAGTLLAGTHKAPARIRLETMSAAGTRWVLGTTYSLLAVAALLAGLDQLGRFHGTVQLAQGVQDVLVNASHVAGGGVVAVVEGMRRMDGEVAVWAGAGGVNGSVLSGFGDVTEGSAPVHEALTVSFLMGYHAVVWGSDVGANVGWEVVGEVERSAVVHCSRQVLGHTFDCPAVPLFEEFDRTQGHGVGGHSRYAVSVQLVNTSAGWAPSYALRYRVAGYRLATAVMRVVMLVGTLAVCVLWMWHLRAEPITEWMVERKWVLVLLLSVVVWQNPVLVVTGFSFNVSFGVRFVAELLQTVSWAGLFVFWILMMESLKFGSNVDASGKELQVAVGGFGWCFYLPKVMFGIAFFFLAAGMQLLKRPDEWFGVPEVDAFAHNEKLLVAGRTMLFLFVLAMLTWLCWFVSVSLATGRVLKKLHYLTSRYRQLSFRFLLFQQTVVIGYYIVGSAAGAIRATQAFLFEADSTLGDDTLRFESAVGIEQSLSLLVGSFQQVGDLVLLSVYAWCVAFVYLPPLSRGAKPGFKFLKKYLNLEDEAVAQYKFNLDTAAWLFDLSWAAYYDPPGVETPSAFGRIEHAPHGFVVDAFVSDRRLDTHAVVLRKGQRVVVAFRGTCSRRNFYADFKFSTSEIAFLNQQRHEVASRLPVIRNALPLAHFGFLECYAGGLRDGLRPAVTASLMAAGQGARLYTTGHSLGGAMATIFALDAKPLVRRLRETQMRMPTPRGIHVRRSLPGRMSIRESLQRMLPNLRQKAHSTTQEDTSSEDEDLGASLASLGRPNRGRARSHEHSRRVSMLDDDFEVKAPALAVSQSLATSSSPPAAAAKPPEVLAGYASSDKDVDAGTADPSPVRSAMLDTSHDGDDDVAFDPAGDAESKSVGDEPEALAEPEPEPGLVLERHDSVLTSASAHSVVIDVRGEEDDGTVFSSSLQALTNSEGAAAAAPGCLGNKARHRRVPTDGADWLGDRGRRGMDRAQEEDQGCGIVPEELELDETGDMDIVMMSFGAPRVGNVAFGHLFNHEIRHAYRIVFEGDVVAGVPRFLFLYHHVGHLVELDREGNTLVDPSAIERVFRSRPRRDFSAHSMYMYRDGLRRARVLAGAALPDAYKPDTLAPMLDRYGVPLPSPEPAPAPTASLGSDETKGDAAP